MFNNFSQKVINGKTSDYQNYTHKKCYICIFSWFLLKENVGYWPSKLDILFCWTHYVFAICTFKLKLGCTKTLGC